MRWDCLLLVAAMVFAGCARKLSDGRAQPFSSQTSTPAANPPNSPSVIVTPSALRHGRISSVNPSARFVVITYSLGGVPAVERRLNVYRAGLKVAEVKVTGPTRDTNTVADIVAGECQVGDEVRED